MEYERIREEIINQYIDDISQAVNISPSLSILRRYGIKFADQILSIKGLEIRAENQFYPILDSAWQEHYANFAQFPKTVEAYEESVYGAFIAGMKTQQEGMKEAGFVKVINKEGRDGS